MQKTIFLSLQLLLIMTLKFESKSLQASEKWKLKYILHILHILRIGLKQTVIYPSTSSSGLFAVVYPADEKKTVPISTLLGFQQFRSWFFSTFFFYLTDGTRYSYRKLIFLLFLLSFYQRNTIFRSLLNSRNTCSAIEHIVFYVT